jgi:hypothetical protein
VRTSLLRSTMQSLDSMRVLVLGIWGFDAATVAGVGAALPSGVVPFPEIVPILTGAVASFYVSLFAFPTPSMRVTQAMIDELLDAKVAETILARLDKLVRANFRELEYSEICLRLSLTSIFIGVLAMLGALTRRIPGGHWGNSISMGIAIVVAVLTQSAAVFLIDKSARDCARTFLKRHLHAAPQPFGIMGRFIQRRVSLLRTTVRAIMWVCILAFAGGGGLLVFGIQESASAALPLWLAITVAVVVAAIMIGQVVLLTAVGFRLLNRMHSRARGATSIVFALGMELLCALLTLSTGLKYATTTIVFSSH